MKKDKVWPVARSRQLQMWLVALAVVLVGLLFSSFTTAQTDPPVPATQVSPTQTDPIVYPPEGHTTLAPSIFMIGSARSSINPFLVR